jgi:hypothetical protein
MLCLHVKGAHQDARGIDGVHDGAQLGRDWEVLCPRFGVRHAFPLDIIYTLAVATAAMWPQT